MTSPWVRAQDRRRNLVAAASTACFYALAFAAAWLVGMLAPVSLASVPGTVIVDLGGREGPAGQVPLGLPNAPDRPSGEPPGAAPLPAAGSEPPPAAAKTAESSNASMVAAIPAPTGKASAKAATLAARQVVAPSSKAIPSAKEEKAAAAKAALAQASAAQEAAAQAAAQERAAEEAAAERAAEATALASAAPAKTRKFGSGSSSGAAGAPVSSAGTGSSPGVEGGTGTATFRGSEMGSALTTTFGASTGLVGRNLYVPIYRYMPLPTSIDPSINKNIAAKETFRHYYDISGPVWQLKSQPPIANRDDYWNALEAANYDASKADYKSSRKLSPVVLEFAVGPLAQNNVELVDVRIVSSSGDPDIDQAVIYGFKRGAFFNKTGYAVGGKFVYQF